MSDLLSWVWNQIVWLMGLAKPDNLQKLVNLGGPEWVSYAILFAIIFSETGLLVGFFLPGDSLLFAAGFLSSQQTSDGRPVFDIFALNALLIVAAILGDAVNYYLGRQTGEHVFERGRMRFVKRKHLLAARDFYARHGGKAIVLARFVPIVRTFTPFVAGIARMGYRRFVLYNVLGGAGWVLSMTMAGYWLGQIEFIQKNFEMVVITIVLVSVMPMVIGVLKHRASQDKAELEVAAKED